MTSSFSLAVPPIPGPERVALPQLPVSPGLHHPTRPPHPLDDPTLDFDGVGEQTGNLLGFEDEDDYPGLYDTDEEDQVSGGEPDNLRHGVDRGYYEDESSAQDMDVKSTLAMGAKNNLKPTDIDYWLKYNDSVLRWKTAPSTDAKIQGIRAWEKKLSDKQRWCLASAIAKDRRNQAAVLEAEQHQQRAREQAEQYAEARKMKEEEGDGNEIQRDLLTALLSALTEVRGNRSGVQSVTFTDLNRILTTAVAKYVPAKASWPQYAVYDFGHGTTWALVQKCLEDGICKMQRGERRAVAFINKLTAGKIPKTSGLANAIHRCSSTGMLPPGVFARQWNDAVAAGTLMDDTADYAKYTSISQL